MLLKQTPKIAVTGFMFTGLLTLLASCSDGTAIEGFISADPQLVKNSLEEQTQAELPRDISADPQGMVQPGSRIDGSDESSLDSRLPPNFPKSFPLYPQAQFQEVKPGKNEASGIVTWYTPDNRNAVADYYEEKLTANGWEVIKPFTLNPQLPLARAIAIKNDLRVDLTLLSLSDQNKVNDVESVKGNGKSNAGKNSGTKLSLIYQPLNQEKAQSRISETINAEGERSPAQSGLNKLKPKQESPTNVVASKPKTGFSQTIEKQNGDEVNNQKSSSSRIDFDDIDQAPEQLRQPLESVAALNVLTPYTAGGNIELTKFAPNRIITKGEYARWLIAANNRYFEDASGKKIYLATDTNDPAFQDVKPSNPDFEAIQSLAEAGLIPSRLTEDSTHLLFKPDAPLKREDLVSWKVPLDMRQALPQASIEAIKESWGFKDVADIESTATRALYADFQNGDRSNVRRIFGYTTLFQPKKSVTRAEAAASLWYFGFQGDGITAREVMEAELNK